MAVSLTSCNKDDDNRFSIVGTWMEIDSDEDVTIYLYANGAGKYTEKGYSNTFTYTFNSSGNILSITMNGKTEITVVTVVSNDMIIIEGDKYMRIN